jgi:AraC-like DNA-binding protein
MTPTVRGATLSNYAEVAAQVGLDPGPLLRRFGIERRALSDPDVRLAAARVIDLLEESAALSDCPTFGLRMAASRQLSDLGAVSLLLTHQATMRDVLMTMVQYRQLLNPVLVIDVEEHDDVVVIREELLVSGRGQMRQATELAIGVLFRLFRAVLGPRWSALSVDFAHAAPPDTTVYRRLFGPICRFGGDFNGLTCRRDDLNAPNPAADPTLARFAERYVRSLPRSEDRSLTNDVQKAIYLLLPIGEATLGRVADSLGLNERTLQRRLVAEGGDFTELLDEIRRGLAARYVSGGGLPMSHVAGLLGYSRQTSFNRWFAEAFGASPTRWRQREAAARK